MAIHLFILTMPVVLPWVPAKMLRYSRYSKDNKKYTQHENNASCSDFFSFIEGLQYWVGVYQSTCIFDYEHSHLYSRREVTISTNEDSEPG